MGNSDKKLAVLIQFIWHWTVLYFENQHLISMINEFFGFTGAAIQTSQDALLFLCPNGVMLTPFLAKFPSPDAMSTSLGEFLRNDAINFNLTQQNTNFYKEVSLFADIHFWLYAWSQLDLDVCPALRQPFVWAETFDSNWKVGDFYVNDTSW